MIKIFFYRSLLLTESHGKIWQYNLLTKRGGTEKDNSITSLQKGSFVGKLKHKPHVQTIQENKICLGLVHTHRLTRIQYNLHVFNSTTSRFYYVYLDWIQCYAILGKTCGAYNDVMKTFSREAEKKIIFWKFKIYFPNCHYKALCNILFYAIVL